MTWKKSSACLSSPGFPLLRDCLIQKSMFKLVNISFGDEKVQEEFVKTIKFMLLVMLSITKRHVFQLGKQHTIKPLRKYCISALISVYCSMK